MRKVHSLTRNSFADEHLQAFYNYVRVRVSSYYACSYECSWSQ